MSDDTEKWVEAAFDDEHDAFTSDDAEKIEDLKLERDALSAEVERLTEAGETLLRHVPGSSLTKLLGAFMDDTSNLNEFMEKFEATEQKEGG